MCVLMAAVCAPWGVGRQGKETALAIGHTCMDSKDIISVNKGIGELFVIRGGGSLRFAAALTCRCLPSPCVC